MGSNNMTRPLTLRENLETDTHMGRRPSEDKGSEVKAASEGDCGSVRRGVWIFLFFFFSGHAERFVGF